MFIFYIINVNILFFFSNNIILNIIIRIIILLLKPFLIYITDPRKPEILRNIYIYSW